MQQQFEDIYLAPIGDGQAPVISSLVDIPTNNTLLQDYIEWPSVEKNRIFLVRIMVKSNHSLGEYKTINQFRQYLARENIVLDYNNLDSIDPVHVGFIEDIIPRYETLQLHHERLSALLPVDAPMFQLNIQSIYGRSRERSKVVMINSDISNVNILKTLFNNLNKEESIPFYPWM
jgi:hypothetical protein